MPTSHSLTQLLTTEIVFNLYEFVIEKQFFKQMYFLLFGASLLLNYFCRTRSLYRMPEYKPMCGYMLFSFITGNIFTDTDKASHYK